MTSYPDVGVGPEYGDAEEDVDGRTEARVQNGRDLQQDGTHVGRRERQADAGDAEESR